MVGRLYKYSGVVGRLYSFEKSFPPFPELTKKDEKKTQLQQKDFDLDLLTICSNVCSVIK